MAIFSIGLQLFTVNSASAAQPPQFRELLQKVTYSTRAIIEPLVETFGAEAVWKAGYSTHENPQEYMEGWIPASSGILAPTFGTTEISIGMPDGTTSGNDGDRCFVLHHLQPNTVYYAHFEIETDGGFAQHTFSFKTLPAGNAEIPALCSGGASTFKETGGSRTTRSFAAQVETNGNPTEFHFEYSSAAKGPWQPFTSAANGSISVSEDFAIPSAEIAGLTAEKTYYARIRACREGIKCEGEVKCEIPTCVEKLTSFETPTAKVIAYSPEYRNVTATSARLDAKLNPGGSETRWRFESATASGGPWTPISGAEGIITQGQAEALPEAVAPYVEGLFSGLTPSTSYYVRLFAENVEGEGINEFSEPLLTETRGIESFKTMGPPIVTTLPVAAYHGESLRLLGTVNPNDAPTSNEQTITINGAPTSGTFTLTFDGQTTTPINYDASASGGSGSVRNGLESLPSKPQLAVYGFAGGPFTVVFGGSDGGVSEPQMTADGTGLVPSTSIVVATTQGGGEGYEVKYHFEYVGEKEFERSGFTNAGSTPELSVAAGDTSQFIGQDLPTLEMDENYRYRLAATSTVPGGSVADSASRSLVVPPEAISENPGACRPGESRGGASVKLPDCRAYEQVTPVDKEGAQEAFNYGPTVVSGAVVAENGVRVALEDPAVSWGTGPDAGQSPYFFSREESRHQWELTAGIPQPEFGVQRVVPELFSNDLTEVAFEDDVHTSVGSGESKDVQYEVGPAGGPYKVVAVVPRKQIEGGAGYYEGWVASSEDFSKLILQVEDHDLVTPHTNTINGNDLYEYENGSVNEVNVGIGTCGAHIASGEEANGVRSSSHAVSANGAKVFFEATPGNNCSAPTHLYMRKNGNEVIDLGPYRFAGADHDGIKVLLEREQGDTDEYFIYDTETQALEQIYSQEARAHEEGLRVSEGFGAIYFHAPNGDLYRYDVASGKLNYLFRDNGDIGRSSPDGSLYYFQGDVPGVPGENQVFLYNAPENIVQCISCASPFDPEPKLGAVFPHHTIGDLGPLQSSDGYPIETFLSENGDFAFFDTPSALVSADVDGEIAPAALANEELQSTEFSPSSDVYEWRKSGIDGCEQVDGCIALITDGRGGFLNLVIGATPSGDDVFIYTSSQLAAQDDDKAGDIYDVRINGGQEPPVTQSVECEGDACSTPASAPNDATPASSTFNGAGNVSGSKSTKKNDKSVKVKKKKKKKKVKKKSRKAKKTSRGSGRRGK